MRLKINSSKILVNALFLLVSLLISAVGLKMLSPVAVEYLFHIGVCFGIISTVILICGFIYPLLYKRKRSIPSAIRRKLIESFKFAEENPERFLRKIKGKNCLFTLYYFAVSLVGSAFFICISFCFIIKPITLVFLPLAFITVAPVRKAIEYLLKKDSAPIESGILQEEFPTVYKLFDDVVKRELGQGFKLCLDFGSTSLSAVKNAKTVYINVNSYAFLLLNDSELRALAVRELRALKDKRCKDISRILKSRSLYLTVSPTAVFSAYFSFVIADTATKFDFSKNALNRILERRKDEILKNTQFATPYLTAYKKQKVLDGFFVDARSFITLSICKDELAIREFVSFIYNLFLERLPSLGADWERDVENKLKAIVCDRLTYKEKTQIFGFEVQCGEFVNNCSEEQKTLYDKYNLEYYESTKRAHEPKKRAIEGYYRDIERYEQYPKEYDERLKLIGIAHAYYMTAQLDKAEKIYCDIIASGDTTPEVYFDYGSFLLLAKRDAKGVEYVYKAMENENVVEEGLEVLGRYFITVGDKEGYERFCEYKTKRLDEIVSGFDEKMLDRNASFENASLGSQVLDEIVERLSKDDNLEEIYCADSRTKSGGKITVFAISVRNKNQDALAETYERVFSILDNDYGKYDTFLIAIDVEGDEKLVNRLVKDGKFRVFKR